MLIFQKTSFENLSIKGYPQKKLQKCLKNVYRPKVIVQNVPKIGAFDKLSFLGSSFQIPKKLKKILLKNLCLKLKIVFTSRIRAKAFSQSVMSCLRFLRLYVQNLKKNIMYGICTQCHLLW